VMIRDLLFFLLSLTCALSCAFFLLSVEAAPVNNLPGYTGNLSMDAGYLNIDEVNGRNYFYWLIESEKSPETDPLVVWFQGGPGCSSLDGLLSENGPFTPNAEGTLDSVDLGWTKHANMLWVESPLNVGFSYSTDPKDRTTTDTKTAQLNYEFLQRFLEVFPQYQGRDLWLTGESYAGVYVPMLANLIVTNTSSALNQQFKGFMMGNPVLGCAAEGSDDLTLNILYWHGLVSYQHYAQWLQNDCAKKETQTCSNIMNSAINQVGEIYQQLVVINPTTGAPAAKNQPSLDPDDLFQDFCTDNGTLNFAENLPNDCHPSGNLITKYLNRADVQTAINVKPTKWAICSNTLNYESNVNSIIPYYKNVFQLRPDVKVLVYSGDIDVLTVPFPYTQACLSELNDATNPQTVKWQPWFVNGATAGYTEAYANYTYATVKGAGHEVPGYQPLTAFNLFGRFLTNHSLLTSDSSIDSITKQKILRDRAVPTQGDVLRAMRNFNRKLAMKE